MNVHSWLLSSVAIWPDPLFSHRGYLYIEIDHLTSEELHHLQEELERNLKITIDIYAPGHFLMPEANLYHIPLPNHDVLYKIIDETSLSHGGCLNRIIYKDLTLHMGMPSRSVALDELRAGGNR